MPRPPRSARSQPADRSGPSHSPFDELAALRGKLREERVLGRRIEPAAPARKSGNDTRSEEDGGAGLFQAALQGVKPLAHSARRAEVEAPKPPPVPRPRAPEPEDETPAASPRRGPPRTDDEFFRFAMEDVIPIDHGNRAEVGVDHRHTRRHDAPGPASPPIDPFLLLPPDGEGTDPADLFRYAARGAQPVDTRNRAEVNSPQPLPHPLKHFEDEREALRESMEAPMTLEDRLETGEEAAFLRPGLPRRVLTDLRRGRWVLQAQLDLHGCNRDEARAALADFLAASLQQGRRCVRVIHGKGHGSPGKQSILKHLSRGWLAQREEILAFCQAGPHDGGSGALLVLLRAGNPARS
ncbi:Smr/MutS family protein [Azoarcus sp. DN11]|uniref:Smr/MutS family protein n=1 Tax=Azoarcus sp. DN11 TaxID=356837 RepID=UPI000EAC8B98|nr:Smr/MutS family protein [Azoarcus sp. DN11]AYH45008.1 DNA mismatch repair protein MutS [Azoarcus sp. DN11]